MSSARRRSVATVLSAESIAACAARADVYRLLEVQFARLTTMQNPAKWAERMRKLAEDWERTVRDA